MPDERPTDRQDPEDIARSDEGLLLGDGAEDDGLEGEHPYRGELVNDTFATVCPGFGPSPLRFICHRPALRIQAACGAIAIPLAVGALAAGSALQNLDGAWATMLLAPLCYGIGASLAFLAAINVILIIAGYGPAAHYFKNALLTPGVVASSSPLVVVALAPLGNGRGPRYHGLQRLDLKWLPYHSREPGTRVPCVSSFWPAPGLDRWLHFFPVPICWGTGDREKMDQCFNRLGTEDLDRLDECIRRGLIPSSDDELILLDANDRKLGSYSIREEKEKYPQPGGNS